MTDKIAQRRYIGIKQAKRTIYNILKRRRQGAAKPDDQKVLSEAEASLRRWQTVK